MAAEKQQKKLMQQQPHFRSVCSLGIGQHTAASSIPRSQALARERSQYSGKRAESRSRAAVRPQAQHSVSIPYTREGEHWKSENSEEYLAAGP